MKISHFKQISLGSNYLPNSICFYGDMIYGCDAKNRIFKVNKNGIYSELFAGEGYAKYKFRQPVYITYNNNMFAIADWHNHRIIFYNKNFKYIGEIGEYGERQSFFLYNFIKKMRRILSTHNYMLNHFKSEIQVEKQNDTFSQKVKRLFWFYFCRTKLSKKILFNKPNGIAFGNSQLLVTQKKNKSIQIFKISKKSGNFYFKLTQEISILNNKKLGRLGSCIYKFDHYYICDEGKNIVWILNKNGDYLDQLEFNNEIQVFTCDLIDVETLVVGGRNEFLVFNLKTRKIITKQDNLAEVHDIIYNASSTQLHICCRASASIQIYDVSS